MLRTAEARFRAMGTDCHAQVVAHADVAEELLQLTLLRTELLEECWSRFRPASELNRLNAEAGNGPIAVSADLYTLVDRMRQAWVLSQGLFDPTVLASMNALGYNADFPLVAARIDALDAVALAAAPGMSGVVLDPEQFTVCLPHGVGVDPGAIGKGLAADIVTSEILEAGAHGVLVNLGGDVSIKGQTADGTGWSIGVEDERSVADDSDRVVRVLEFPDAFASAGVATSSTLKRRWAQGRRHHVIDPRTGNMGASDLVQVTVVSDSAWLAEITATTALLLSSDEAEAWLREHDVTAILLTPERMIVTADEGALRG